MSLDLATISQPNQFSNEDVQFFHENGYIIVRNLATEEMVTKIRDVTQSHIDQSLEPLEYEADVNYPGSPTSRDAIGGSTIRRLKNAIARHPVFSEWISQPELATRLRQLLRGSVVCPLAHHNCVMTKLPEFSSQTGWHQDIRYWAFQKPELISTWLALGSERKENGCLQLIPQSHRVKFSQNQFDEETFFREDAKENQPFLEKAIAAELNAGDVLFFHSLTLHAAGRNETDQRKFAAVFTFRNADNTPLPGSRSASMPELILPQG